MVVADESTELPIAVPHELIKFALTIFDTFQGKIMSKQDRPVKRKDNFVQKGGTLFLLERFLR